jgi:WD40 repeat protein
VFRKQWVSLLALIWLLQAIVAGGNGNKEGNKGADSRLPKGAISRLGKTQHQHRRLGALSVTFLPNGTLASTGPEGKLVFWNPKTGKALRSLEGHPFVVFSADGKIMASHSGNKNDQAIRLLEVDSEKEIASINAISHYLFFREFCFSRDGRFLFVGGGTEHNRKDDPPLCAWELAKSKNKMEFPLREKLQCIAVSPNGRLLATSAYSRHNVQIWDAKNHKETQRLSSDTPTQVSGIAFSPDSSCLACVGQFPAVRLSDVATGKERWRILTVDDWACSAAFSPQGRMIAIGTASPKGSVYLVESATGSVRGRFEYGAANKVAVWSVAFSPDGLLLASAATDGAPLIWDVTGRILARGPAEALETKDLDDCWHYLSSRDGAKAWQAILALEARPQQAMALIRERLAPNPKLGAERLAKLQADLNDDAFQVRERASRQFEVLGQAAASSLRKILASSPPVEVRKRVKKLLGKIGKNGLVDEELRSLRAHEILESIASPEGRQLLAIVASGEPAARVTQDAKATLDRMGNAEQ